ncbi:MAG TPA: hypothetical protein VE008_07355 [Burkholderiales bacterium]|nr:hypothetical protein [Burkholderiales bacterium]
MADFTLKIGGKEYSAKRVNLATLKKHKEFLKRGAAMAASGKIDLPGEIDGLFEMTAIVHACIARANPGVSLEEIEEGLNQDELVGAFNAVMTGSGFASSGEPKPESSPT